MHTKLITPVNKHLIEAKEKKKLTPDIKESIKIRGIRIMYK